MEILEKLFKKKRKVIVGLMSGTSADGIDAALIEIRGSGTGTKFRQLAFHTYPYPKGLKSFLLKNSSAKTARLDEVARLNLLIGMYFSDATRNIVRQAGYRLTDVDLIGSHGQTIQHLPNWEKLFGRNVRSTLQIGDPSVIAKLTGVITVGDFRIGDVAVGGSGAPLVPYFDWLLFRSTTANRGLLNIGGIANITILPRRSKLSDIQAFDTGPGNMVVDALMQRFYGKSYDKDGKIASQGKIIPSLLHRMMQHPYLKLKPPKSTGREMFGEEFITEILRRTRNDRKKNIITTASEFTASSVYDSSRFIRPKVHLDEIIVSGGGVHNKYIMQSLEKHFSETSLMPIDNLGFSSDEKEAIAFAILANETIAGNPSNVPGATGAQRTTVLGKICLP
jgi:anhydro-N-acetylmuramic acid kinase